MKQITKFYASSFLKNQTYFTPVFVVLLQFHHLSFQEIFLVFAIGSAFSLFVEIPTGIFADLYGKRRSVIISKLLIFVSFVIFGFSTSFWAFVIAQVVFELGNSFRTGTETAYVYDYLGQNRGTPMYSEVKGKQKFYARIGEAISSAAGGFIAASFGFNAVFFFSSVPAFLNFLIAARWERIKEAAGRVTTLKSIRLAKESIRDVAGKDLIRITANITIFTGVLAAAAKFIQPYMTEVAIPIELFGIVYAVSLGTAAIAVRYSYVFEKRFGDVRVINALSFMSFIPLLILGFGYVSLIGVALFFIVVVVENIRSPIANSVFHSFVESEKRATIGSVLSLFKAAGKSAILPLVGFIADAFTMYEALLVLSAMLFVNALLFRIPNKSHKSKNKG